jgi:hypothetical protein
MHKAKVLPHWFLRTSKEIYFEYVPIGGTGRIGLGGELKIWNCLEAHYSP